MDNTAIGGEVMIDISGHLRDYRNENGFMDCHKSLSINCCGYQSFKTQDAVINRRCGRNDYQLIYIHAGKGYFKIGGKWKECRAGTFILYRPHEPQIYKYKAKDKVGIYWIHFTGFDCEAILHKYNIKTEMVGVDVHIKNIYQDMILELQLKKPGFEDLTALNFQRLLLNINRILELDRTAHENSFEIDRLIIHLNQNYRRQWNVQQMAEFCGISKDYFAHLFKDITNMAPLKFLTDIRIEKAKSMLLLEDKNISDVAYFLGYSDPLYFSRVFRKHTGLSPKEYKESCMQLNTPFATI